MSRHQAVPRATGRGVRVWTDWDRDDGDGKATRRHPEWHLRPSRHAAAALAFGSSFGCQRLSM